jgi:hypothetical protein
MKQTLSAARVQELLSTFNYRNAQTSRACRVRNLKSRRDLLKFAAARAFGYVRSDWLYTAYTLENKKLREFLVFQDWAEAMLATDGYAYEQYPSDHLYAYLGTEPREYSEIERLWVLALNRFNSFGQAGRERPETMFAEVGIESGGAVWPAQLYATMLDPESTVDSSWLDGIRTSQEVQQLSEKVQRINNAVWVSDSEGALKIYLPIAT